MRPVTTERKQLNAEVPKRTNDMKADTFLLKVSMLHIKNKINQQKINKIDTEPSRKSNPTKNLFLRERYATAQNNANEEIELEHIISIRD